MLVTIDKGGSISLPASVRKELGFRPGTHLELTVPPGGAVTLFPVEIYRGIRLSDAGIIKIKEAREFEPAAFPEWFDKNWQRFSCRSF